MRKVRRLLYCLLIMGLAQIPSYGSIPVMTSALIVVTAAVILYGGWTISERWQSKDSAPPGSS
jgi:hypothetical protein